MLLNVFNWFVSKCYIFKPSPLTSTTVQHSGWLEKCCLGTFVNGHKELTFFRRVWYFDFASTNDREGRPIKAISIDFWRFSLHSASCFGPFLDRFFLFMILFTTLRTVENLFLGKIFGSNMVLASEIGRNTLNRS